MKWKIGSKLVGFTNPKSLTPLFAYDYLILDEDYGFLHQDFELEDYRTYFKQVKKLSSKTIDDLIENYKRSDHFHINTASGNILELLKKCTGIDRFTPEQIPSVGQFHLYTSKDTNSKSPRIHFFLGPLGVFYILAFDPFHKIYPMKIQ